MFLSFSQDYKWETPRSWFPNSLQLFFFFCRETETVYQTTETLSNEAFTWWNIYNFQQDVFFVYLEADEMGMDTTTCWNQPLHPWFQTQVAFTDKAGVTKPFKVSQESCSVPLGNCRWSDNSVSSRCLACASSQLQAPLSSKMANAKVPIVSTGWWPGAKIQ